MVTPSEKLASSLAALKELQDKVGVVVKTSEISRTHRERLTNNGFLKEIIRGWYISSNPNEIVGDSTSWYTSFWQFCSRYLEDKYGEEYCLSAEQSLLIHAGNTTVPSQLIVRAIKSSNTAIELPYNTSIYPLMSPHPENVTTSKKNGVKLMSLESALIHCSPMMYRKNAIEMRIALSQIQDSSDILEKLLDGGHSTIAGRLAGAFRNIGSNTIAKNIISTMQIAGYKISETDPFQNKSSIQLNLRDKSPFANRIKLMWEKMRQDIVDLLPKEPGLPEDKISYLKFLEDIRVTDAYHSLSIERYQVTTELIEKVKNGLWDSTESEDKKQRDAMAAKGYWQAGQAVKESIEQILEGVNAGLIAEQDHSDWYRELFAPSVTAGILKASDLAGYRSNQVYIGQSKHIPLSKEGVRDAMPVLFELLSEEPIAGVRAILGHFVFVYIHPYMDGNGRMARFLMNAMLASGGYPWTVIPVEKRAEYMNALENASVEGNIIPFTKFLVKLIQASMDGTPIAK